MNKKRTFFLKRKEILIFLSYFLLLTVLTKPQIIGWAEKSRMATIESLVERDIFYIDDSKYNDTGDKIYINCSIHPKKTCGYYYSEKPPTLSFLSAVIYSIFQNFFRLLKIPLLNYPCCNNYFLTLTIVGTSSSLLLVFFYKSLKFINIKEYYRILATLGLGLGTLILYYSTIFINHVVAANLLFISFYLLLKLKFLKNINIKKNIFLIGFLISLATVIEYLVGIFLILFFIYILSTKKLRQFFIYFILGVTGPIILHFVLNYMAIGSIKPGYFLKRAYIYPNSPWPGIEEEKYKTEPLLQNLSRKIIGDKGLISFSPILLIPFLYLIWNLFDKDSLFKKEAWIIFLGILSLILFYVTAWHSKYGGTYGFRFLIIIIPLVMFFIITFFQKNKSPIILSIFYISFIFSLVIQVKSIFNFLENFNLIFCSFLFILISLIIIIIHSIKNRNYKKNN